MPLSAPILTHALSGRIMREQRQLASYCGRPLAGATPPGRSVPSRFAMKYDFR